ncbi:MAG: hypothetical protein ABJ205_01640 [Erythrobacter sp.]|uniref:hypothetical protein n=1 Tax=Erythrobacter sp. TaxID=1042 RepID=UPI003264E56B
MMTPEEATLNSWKDDSAIASLPPITELRERSARFTREIRRRNFLEYVGGGLAILVIAVVAWLVPIDSLRIGAALLAGGVGIALWQLRSRGTPLSPPLNSGQLPILDYQRQELVRQKDVLRSSTIWYLLPLIPGLFVLLGMPFIDPNWPKGDDTLLDQLVRPAFVIVVLVAVYRFNKKAARKLQSEIDEIDALRYS